VTVSVSYLLEERPTVVLGLASIFSLFYPEGGGIIFLQMSVPIYDNV